MRIGINGLLLSDRAGYRRSGISRYLDRLLAALPAHLGGDEGVVYTGRGISLPASNRLRQKSSWLPVEHPAARVAWEQLALPILTRLDRLDLFHGTVNVLPRSLPCPSVVTIHDLAFLRWPEQIPARRYRYLSTEVRRAVKHATRIIAVSEWTKSDIVTLLGVDPARVVVTHLGVDPHFQPRSAAAVDAVLARSGRRRPYLLAVGNLEPRKNLPELLRAFAQIAGTIPHDLVLVGAEGWLTGEIHETLSHLGLQDRVQMTGFVADEDLPAWYSGADLFVFPSLYEGFGLPLLEAMACGTPVVTSNTSSLPEVAGDAAITVEPTAGAIAAGITNVLSNSSLANQLRERGRQRAATFTWDHTAARTAAVYREVGR